MPPKKWNGNIFPFPIKIIEKARDFKESMGGHLQEIRVAVSIFFKSISRISDHGECLERKEWSYQIMSFKLYCCMGSSTQSISTIFMRNKGLILSMEFPCEKKNMHHKSFTKTYIFFLFFVKKEEKVSGVTKQN